MHTQKCVARLSLLHVVTAFAEYGCSRCLMMCCGRPRASPVGQVIPSLIHDIFRVFQVLGQSKHAYVSNMAFIHNSGERHRRHVAGLSGISQFHLRQSGGYRGTRDVPSILDAPADELFQRINLRLSNQQALQKAPQLCSAIISGALQIFGSSDIVRVCKSQ